MFRQQESKQSIEDVIGDEIKRDIASRYFGFRKIIEEESLDFQVKLKYHISILEKRISFDLIRIYILLKDDDLIAAFLGLVGFEKRLFYDPYLVESPTIRARVFQGLHTSGFTRFRRFRNLVLDCYDRLEIHTRLYGEKLRELESDLEIINEEIRLFYKKNDLAVILGFLKSLGKPPAAGNLEGGLEVGIAEALEKKMALSSFESLDHYLPVVGAVPPLSEVAGELKEICAQAFENHSKEDQDFFATKTFPIVLRNR